MADNAYLLPILMVGLLFVIVALGYLIQFISAWEGRRSRIKQAAAHLQYNHIEIQAGVLTERARQGYTSLRVRMLLNWMAHEGPLLKGEDAGLLLTAQEATLRELEHANGSR